MVALSVTAGIDYSIPICFILNQQEEMVALSILLVSLLHPDLLYTKPWWPFLYSWYLTPSRSVIY